MRNSMASLLTQEYNMLIPRQNDWHNVVPLKLIIVQENIYFQLTETANCEGALVVPIKSLEAVVKLLLMSHGLHAESIPSDAGHCLLNAVKAAISNAMSLQDTRAINKGADTVDKLLATIAQLYKDEILD